MQLNLQSGIPIYEQLKEQIARFTALGILNESERLPSVRALAKDLSVNPNTVQRAYSQLEADGIIYTISGKGCFIASGNSAKIKMINETEKCIHKDLVKAKELEIGKKKIIDMVETVYKNN